MSFKKQVRDFISTNRTVVSVLATQEAKDDVIAAYVKGAKDVAKLTCEIGDVLQAATPGLSPPQLAEIQGLFARIKEIVDHE